VLAVRDRAGRVNLMLAGDARGEPVPVARVPLPTTAASAASGAAAGKARAARAARSAASGAAGAAPASRWKATLAALSIRAGQLDWRDATTAPEAALALGEFSFDAQAIAWPLDAPVVFKGAGVLGSAEERGKLAFSGQGNAAGAKVDIQLDAMPLGPARPYLRGALEPPLAGQLSADLNVEWKAGAGARRSRSRRAGRARRLSPSATPRRPSSRPRRSSCRDARIDTVARTAALGSAAPAGAAGAARARRGRRLELRALAAGAAASSAAPARAPQPRAPAASALGRRVGALAALPGQLALDKGQVGFSDRAVARAGGARSRRHRRRGQGLRPRRQRARAVPAAHEGRGAGGRAAAPPAPASSAASTRAAR
jgi:hypothetical protein